MDNADDIREVVWGEKTKDIVAYRKAWRDAHPGYFTKKKADWEKRLKKSDPGRWREYCDAKAERDRRRYEDNRKAEFGPEWKPQVPPTDDEQAATKRAKNKRRYYTIKEKHPEKYAAKLAVKDAIRSGLLVSMPCVICGDPKSDGHHEDYSKQLEVVWLCRSHHLGVHKLMKETSVPNK